MQLSELISVLDSDGRLVHLEHLPARPALCADLSQPLPPQVRALFPVEHWWSHQAQAIDLLRAGQSVAVATGTASGKSLCYQVAMAAAAHASSEEGRPPPSALLIFPTKALAQDQLRSLTALELPQVVPICYDGDTSPEERTRARRHATALFTNPDMLHVGLLPHHGRWADFLTRLEYVVLDELHTLRGMFGSHVAQLLRRLRRLCAHYGSNPTFVFCSATIGEPARLATALAGVPVTAVTEDGSPRGERFFALWNPPLLDAPSGRRASAHSETANLVAELVDNHYRTIAFCRSRRGTELVAAEARRRVEAVRPYRGGYLPSERREIEAQLFGGDLRGVVATSALELGIDVAGLDACVLDGFPGTIASMWQQAGRAGRQQQSSLAVLVAGNDQLDQWLMAHPDEVFARPPEPAVINPSNPFVLLPHLACAAYETPLSPADETWWGDDLDEGVRQLVTDDRLKVRDGRAFWAGQGSPAWRVGLRSGSSVEYQILDGEGSLIGTVDASRAFVVLHPGAVYLHQGQAWQVEHLDLEDRVAYVTPTSGQELTQVRAQAGIRVKGEDERCAMADGVELHLGAVEVSEQVVGYQRRDVFSGAVLCQRSLDLPPTSLATRAFWYTFDPGVLRLAGVEPSDWPGTLHALEHAAIGILPLFAICDRWDVGGVSTPFQVDTGRPSVFIYDGYPGGAGIAELGWSAGRRHLAATLDVMEACHCEAGCPSCVQSPKCGNLNEPLDKGGALALMRVVMRSSTG